jgi:hypothetical protein
MHNSAMSIHHKAKHLQIISLTMEFIYLSICPLVIPLTPGHQDNLKIAT